MNGNDRTVVGLTMVSHALVHTYELSIPLLMVIWLTEFPINEATLGIVVSAGYGLFGLGALPSGIISDKVGSQWMIAACLLGMGMSFVILSLSTSVLFIGVAICLWGAAASIYHPAGLSLLSTGVTEKGTGFAYHGMAGNAGIAIGPLVAIVLLWFVEWRWVTLILAVPAFLAIVVILKADIDETAAVTIATDGSGEDQSIKSLGEFITASRTLLSGGFVIVLLVIVFNGLFYRGVLTFLPDLLADFASFQLPALHEGALADEMRFSDFIYVGLLTVGIGGQYVGGKAIDRIPVQKGLLIGYGTLVVIALLFTIALEAGLSAIVGVSLLLGFALFMLQPMYQYAVAEYSSADARGLSYGYTYVAQFGVGALGAAIIGMVLTYSVPQTAFLVLTGFAIAATVISLILYLRY